MTTTTWILLMVYFAISTFAAGVEFEKNNHYSITRRVYESVTTLLFFPVVFVILLLWVGLQRLFLGTVGKTNAWLWFSIQVAKIHWRLGTIHFIKDKLAFEVLEQRLNSLKQKGIRKYEQEFLEKYLAECRKRGGVNETVFG